jgi:plastocyanin
MRSVALVTGIACIAALARARADGGGTIAGTVKVTRPSGVEAGPILVYVVGFTEPAPDAAAEVQQREKHFVPDLVGITAGETVAFPNSDPFLHNVFSPTEARRFDLGSYPKGEVRKRKFPELGVVDVYCNVHPEMSATIVVLPNRRHAIVKPDGSFKIEGVPPGKWTVFAYSRRAAKPASAKVDVGASGGATVELALDEIQREFKHENKFGEKYRAGDEYRPSH